MSYPLTHAQAARLERWKADNAPGAHTVHVHIHVTDERPLQGMRTYTASLPAMPLAAPPPT